MPQVIDYQNSFIYQLKCNDINILDTYVGASCDWIERGYKHKSCCNNENTNKYNFYVYQFIRNNGGWANWTMFKICDYPCETRFERDAEERRYIELLGATLNKAIPTRTNKEYRDDNKEHIKIAKKEYRDKNKQKLLDQKKEYRDKNKQKISEQKKVYYQAKKQAKLNKLNEYEVVATIDDEYNIIEI